MADSLSLRTVKRLSGTCLHCREDAVDGDFCAKHATIEAEGNRHRHNRRRAELAANGLCIRIGCGAKAEAGKSRCRRCAKEHAGAMRSLRKMRRGVPGERRGVPSKGEIPAGRTARIKVEKAYDFLVDGTERTISRVVFRSRGGQSKSSMDADGVQDISDALRLLTGHGDRLRHLRVVEADLGRIHRAEAHAAVADPLVRALGLIAAEAARLSPDGWKLVRTRLMAIGGEDE